LGGGARQIFFFRKTIGLKFEWNLSVNTERSGKDYCWLYCVLNISVNFDFCFMKKLWDLGHEKLIPVYPSIRDLRVNDFLWSKEIFSAFVILNNLIFNFSFQANWIFLIMQNYQPAHLVLISQKSKLEFWCSTWADQGILERSSNFWQIYSWIVTSSRSSSRHVFTNFPNTNLRIFFLANIM
jgi:hypothetical protein